MIRRKSDRSQSIEASVVLIFLFILFSTESTAQQASGADGAIEEVVVTGSRLTRAESTSPVSVIFASKEELDFKRTTNGADTLNDLPVFGVPSATPITTGSGETNIGLNLVNLRNLGARRTLVLVIGHRHVAGLQGTSAVDMNAIPYDFIEGVEVITDGASSVYGSEAIASVVNVITRTEFEGLVGNAQTHFTDGGDTRDLSLTYGANFDAGRIRRRNRKRVELGSRPLPGRADFFVNR